MAGLEWNDKYLMGHAEIDKQHRKLFELLSNISAMQSLGIRPETERVITERVITEMLDYTILHFEYEEDLFLQADVPDLEHHRRLHTALLSDIRSMRRRLSQGEPISIATIVKFLHHWLLNHILKEDLSYKHYLKKLS